MTCSCDWPLDLSGCCDDLSDKSTEILASAVTQASILMTRLSGFQIGQCPATLRPLSQCRRCRVKCCGGADGIRLSGPDDQWIASVTRVLDGATEVPTTDWRWDADEQVLWRVPPGKWPTKDARWAEDGAEGAFTVEVVVGVAPDSYALAVATTLACEMVKSCMDKKCRLPKNATSVTAQGVTITMSDQELKTVLPEVAGWVELVNPNNARLPARVYSPEVEAAPLGGGGHYRGY